MCVVSRANFFLSVFLKSKKFFLSKKGIFFVLLGQVTPALGEGKFDALPYKKVWVWLDFFCVYFRQKVLFFFLLFEFAPKKIQILVLWVFLCFSRFIRQKSFLRQFRQLFTLVYHVCFFLFKKPIFIHALVIDEDFSSFFFYSFTYKSWDFITSWDLKWTSRQSTSSRSCIKRISLVDLIN